MRHCRLTFEINRFVCRLFPPGFELADDEKTCRDVDECVAFGDYDYDDTAPRTLCSFECLNTIGSWLCLCPPNYHLQSDRRSCAVDYCQHLGDGASNKTKCSHECVDHAEGYQCKCPAGECAKWTRLTPKGHTILR